MNNFSLIRNTGGQLVYLSSTGDTHKGIVPVRAFPISAPDQGISLTDSDGHEVIWINNLADLPEAARALILEELANREFTPKINRIHHVSSYATPSTWQVATDRGDTELLLPGEDHIRRLSHTALLITDAHGVSFLLPDIEALDGHSRKMLDRFL